MDRQLKASKTKTVEDDSAEIEAASFKKFPVEVNALTRVGGWGLVAVGVSSLSLGGRGLVAMGVASLSLGGRGLIAVGVASLSL